MKKLLTYTLALMLVILAAPILPARAAGKGVDDLRGRWDITASVYGGGNPPPALPVYANDLAPHPDTTNAYLASGCMRSPDSQATAPLSLRAIDNLDGTYDVILWSTVV